MPKNKRTYLALGDSMSIDDYTGVPGGGAVAQFFHSLGDDWALDDRTYDGCQMSGVPTERHGDLITITIGGNDLLISRDQHLADNLLSFAAEHLQLLTAIREVNPGALLIVGDIYGPQGILSDVDRQGLDTANAVIRANCDKVGAQLAAIHNTFRGHEATFLCQGIEPTLQGAEAIAQLFRLAFEAWQADPPRRSTAG
jgi:hypothetical protein